MSADKRPAPIPADPVNKRAARKARWAKRFRMFARTQMEKVGNPLKDRDRRLPRFKTIDGKLHQLHATRGWKA
jgi:hypothetical protein